jgi:hypothetical protein
MKALLVLSLVVPAYIWESNVFRLLWKWHICPTFNVEPLNLVQAMGLILVLNYVVSSRIIAKNANESDDAGLGLLIYSQIYATIVLGYGWILTYFV